MRGGDGWAQQAAANMSDPEADGPNVIVMFRPADDGLNIMAKM